MIHITNSFLKDLCRKGKKDKKNKKIKKIAGSLQRSSFGGRYRHKKENIHPDSRLREYFYGIKRRQK